MATYGHRFAMANQPATGLARLLNAARFSLQGLRATYQNEEAFRQECLLLAVAIPLALWLGDTAFERVALIAAVLLVMVVEVLNSAIESVVDRISDEHHSLSGRAKDQASAAVLLSVLIAVAIWLAVLLG